MAITSDDLKKKIERVEFHLEKLRKPESDVAAESHFASLIVEARSVVMYAHLWLVEADTTSDTKKATADFAHRDHRNRCMTITEFGHGDRSEATLVGPTWSKHPPFGGRAPIA